MMFGGQPAPISKGIKIYDWRSQVFWLELG